MVDRIQVDGARQLRRTLRKAGDDLTELKEAHAAAARIAATEAAARAPRRSGALAGSVRSSGTKTAGIVRAGYARVPYAGPIHWGWPARNIEPQPFASEAAKRTQARWTLVYKQAVDKILSRVKGA